VSVSISVQIRPSYRMIVRALLRIAGSTAVLVILDRLLPLDHSSTGAAVTILVTGLVVFIGLVALQVRWIIRSRFPGRSAHSGHVVCGRTRRSALAALALVTTDDLRIRRSSGRPAATDGLDRFRESQILLRRVRGENIHTSTRLPTAGNVTRRSGK
jgi:hypothetical protein